ncbi:MAG TPA: hypothetical protein VMW10_11770 [Alphaproteobacteria bacterium]|nr:hypothetical protein [Alphaproteobacteria bacterium]
MKEKETRVCPNFWENCEDCKHDFECGAGLYHGEENILIKAAEIAERVVIKEAIESANIIKGTWQEKFLQQPSEDIWVWMGKWRTPNLHSVETLPLDGPPKPGGGSKSRSHKKPQKETPEYMKILGM